MGGNAHRSREVTPRQRVAIFVLSRDQLSDLQALVGWLEAAGCERIVLVDSASTYEPLIGYLEASPHEVIRLSRNVGCRAPWACGLIDRLAAAEPFVVSDPDVLPDEGCPQDAVEHLQDVLLRHPEFDTAGLGLRIDDLPSWYPHRAMVREWEARFWEREISPGVYAADVDTTFAAYRPGTPYKVTDSLRTGPPYLARHRPWYRDPRDPDEETAYLLAHGSRDLGHWNRADADPRLAQLALEAPAEPRPRT